MRLLVAAVATTLVLLGSGCSTKPGMGTVTGTLRGVGGPAPGRARTMVGTITAVRTDGPTMVTVPIGDGSYTTHLPTGVATTVRTDQHGRFTLHLPPGRYSMAGVTALVDRVDSGCFASTLPLQVHRGATLPDNITCQIK